MNSLFGLHDALIAAAPSTVATSSAVSTSAAIAPIGPSPEDPEWAGPAIVAAPAVMISAVATVIAGLAR